MAIFAWPSGFGSPWSSLRYMQREMERLLGGRWFEDDRFAGGYPPVNVLSGPDETVVQCELAGVRRDDLEINITGDTLEIKGTKRPPAEEAELTYRLRERGAGDFVRTVVLPDGADAERVEAALKDGILTVRIPKAEAAKPKEITVK
jgi:HSP20 family protein